MGIAVFRSDTGSTLLNRLPNNLVRVIKSATFTAVHNLVVIRLWERLLGKEVEYSIYFCVYTFLRGIHLRVRLLDRFLLDGSYDTDSHNIIQTFICLTNLTLWTKKSKIRNISTTD